MPPTTGDYRASMKGAVLAELTVIARGSSPTVKEGSDSLPNNQRALLYSRATARVFDEVLNPCCDGQLLIRTSE